MTAAPSQTQTFQAPTATVRANLRDSAVFATRLQEPLASQVSKEN